MRQCYLSLCSIFGGVDGDQNVTKAVSARQIVFTSKIEIPFFCYLSTITSTDLTICANGMVCVCSSIGGAKVAA